MNPSLQQLHAYPFEKLRTLFAQSTPPAEHEKISLSIGEPQHPCPPIVINALMEHQALFSKYAATKGLPELRSAIAQWCTTRFKLEHAPLSPETDVLPVSGTREALFSFTQAAIDRSKKAPTVIMPNPCYQIYEGAALLAGAQPYYLPCREEEGFIPNPDDIPKAVLEQCQLFFICTPGNPTGAVYSLDDFKKLLLLADQYDFIIASDECYSELYYDESAPPLGLLQACEQLGRRDFKRCIVFNSLSKRSNLAGVRSGFVAGDADILAHYLLYRTYHGCTMPLPTQHASIVAWGDEAHVIENRAAYRKKYDLFTSALANHWALDIPAGSFYLWPPTPTNDIEFAKALYEELNIVVLPGQFLSRALPNENPGKNRVRMALVATYEQCADAAARLKSSTLFTK